MHTPIKETHQCLHAFCTHPGTKFESQHDGEEVYLILREHPILQIPWILNTFILFILLLLINIVLPQFFNPQQHFVFNLFGVGFIFAYFWVNVLRWVFSVGIITNERVIDIDFFNILYKEVTATTINQISDITSKVGGYLGSFLQYGNVFVKTQGFEQNIEFNNVPQPTQVVHILNDLIKNSPKS
jgi:hypothetical protein